MDRDARDQYLKKLTDLTFHDIRPGRGLLPGAQELPTPFETDIIEMMLRLPATAPATFAGGFAEGSNNDPGDFVIERAFVER